MIGSLVMFFTFPDTLNKPLEEVARLFGDEDLVAIYFETVDIHAVPYSNLKDHSGGKEVKI